MAENKGAAATFDIDDILKEIEAKKDTNKEVTAYLDRIFLEGMIKEYYENLPENFSSLFLPQLINVNEYNFTGADFRGLTKKEFELFDFTECDISSVHLDRVGLEYFIDYIIKKNIKYTNLNLDDADLSPKIHTNKTLGTKCIVKMNLANLDFSGCSFKNCNLKHVIFHNTNIANINFVGSTNMEAKQFATSINFDKAIFLEDKEENEKFINQIKNLMVKENKEKPPFISKTNMFFARIFDPPDPMRIDDPALKK